MKKQNAYLKKQYQQGIVLFIALVALMVMSLAAAALIRNVDTNSMIAGNLSFQQSALVSSSRGGESALAWLKTQSDTGLSVFNNNVKASGYYATYGSIDGAGVDLDDSADLRNNNTWNTYSAVATGSGITAGVETASQNQINYIIERMCSKAAKPANDKTNKCLMGKSSLDPDKGVKSASEAGAKLPSGDSPIYRITVRVTGPKNTQSYSQVYAY
ncbi:MAG: type IV pilus assembly protein PilX [Methylophilaceae bacterium]|jgi:type IV pilus assembly protein PilX